MKRMVIIPSNRAGAFATGEVHWAASSEDGPQSGRFDSFDALRELVLDKDVEIAVIVPGVDVALHVTDVPARAAAQARIAASFALEDEFAVDREELHFALGPSAEEGWTRHVFAVASSKIDFWLSELSAVGIVPNTLIPDFMLLPSDENTLMLVEHGEQVLVRDSGAIGFSIEHELLPHILTDILPRIDAENVGYSAANRDAVMTQYDWGSRVLVVEQGMPPEAFAGFALDQIDRAREFNLLQGAYAVRHSLWQGAALWRRAAALAAAIFLAYVGLLGVEGWRFAREAERREMRAESILMAAFPDIERVVNPRAQLRARLNDNGEDDPNRFYDLAAMVYSAAGPISTLEIEGLQFDNQRGDLAVDIAFQSYPDLEQFKNAIVENGGSVEEGGSRQQNGVIIGEMRVASR